MREAFEQVRRRFGRDWPRRRRGWKPVSKYAAIAWLAFYVWFFWTFWSGRGFLMLFINVDLIVHEAGHLLFGYSGSTFLTILGGSLFQLFVPAALCFQFAWQREPYGTAFCSFVFFQNFLYIGEYMADARAQTLPLVSVGGGHAQHDYTYLLGTLGLLPYDTKIGALVRLIGWAGMLGAMVWLWVRYRRSSERPEFAPL